jgi:hypothetical protein
MNNTSHSDEAIRFINAELSSVGVNEYRFCIENDCYVCDIHGNFYSVCKRQHSINGGIIDNYRILHLKGSVDKYGYTTYRITVDGIRKHLKGHRLMLNAWIGPHPELVVNHKDGNKQNNDLRNLEWCTVAENNRHAIETGLFDPYSIPQKYKIPFCEWMTIYVLWKHCDYSQSELGRMYHCGHSTIKAVIDRITSVLPKEVMDGR